MKTRKPKKTNRLTTKSPITIESVIEHDKRTWKPEFKFCDTRRWRFDFACIAEKIAIEVEGGVFIKSRHTSPLGYLGDMEKYSIAAAIGWRVIRVAPWQAEMLKEYLQMLAYYDGLRPIIRSVNDGGREFFYVTAPVTKPNKIAKGNKK